ncbi:MAG: hypothetical protein AMXMBFR13_01640 [Phycisphaerae bacterium]
MSIRPSGPARGSARRKSIALMLAFQVWGVTAGLGPGPTIPAAQAAEAPARPATPGDALPNRFIIISDLHPHPNAYDQVGILADHVIALQPAFVVVLGDICGDAVPGVSEKEIETVREAFRRLRAAGIEIHPVMGNHDVHHRVEDLKVRWFCEQTPLPLNRLFDATANHPAYRAFMDKGPYNYAFTAGGIHFAIVDSNVDPPSDKWEQERIDKARPRWEAQQKWMIDHFCRDTSNPEGYPTIAFLHHPEYMTGDRGMDSRPLYRVLAGCQDRQTLRAVFGGHWHYGQNWSRGQNLGADVYATPPSVHGINSPVEFIVADVRENRVTFEPRETVTGQVRTGRGSVKYYPIYGQFGSLRSESRSQSEKPN